MTRKEPLSCAWTLRDSCSTEVQSGDVLSKIVVARNVQGEAMAEEGALELTSHEAQGQAVEVGEVTWSLRLPWRTGTVWGTVGVNADGDSGFQMCVFGENRGGSMMEKACRKV